MGTFLGMKCNCDCVLFRYLSVSALEEYFAGQDNVDEIKNAALDVCLFLFNILCMYFV